MLIISATTIAKTAIAEDYRDYARKGFIEQIEKDFAKAQLAHPIKMPPLSFLDVAGKPVELKQYRKKLVIMPFWATWCMNCMLELKGMLELMASLEDDDITQIVILPISTDFKTPQEVEEIYVEQQLSKLPLMFDHNKKATGALDIHSLPTTYIIDEKGYQIAKFTKHMPWPAPATKAQLLKLLAPAQGNSPPNTGAPGDPASSSHKSEKFMLWNTPNPPAKE
ncbi:MAG: TlpA family protein disulfide reductase [Proteobacteria bacterium]|nr:TlpA family protein disulfide reductase [Pseudomonadota bacterium]